MSTSSVAKGILGVVKSYAKKIVFDLAWGFEGKTVEHLPEYVALYLPNDPLLTIRAMLNLVGCRRCASAKWNIYSTLASCIWRLALVLVLGWQETAVSAWCLSF